MDHQAVKHHFLRQLLNHHQGIDQEALVQKSSQSAGVSPDDHRENILDWINFLISTGHVKRAGETITPDDMNRLRVVHDVVEARRDFRAVGADPQLVEFFLSHDR